MLDCSYVLRFRFFERNSRKKSILENIDRQGNVFPQLNHNKLCINSILKQINSVLKIRVFQKGISETFTINLIF